MTNLTRDGRQITLGEKHFEKLNFSLNCSAFVAFFNTHGQESYEQLRPLAYPNSDVFLACFSLISESSFKSIANYWIPEIRQYCPEIPVILVGTKCDERNEKVDERKECSGTIIQRKDAVKLKDKIKAIDYIECSAESAHGVEKVLNATVKAALSYNHSRIGSRKSCTIS